MKIISETSPKPLWIGRQRGSFGAFDIIAMYGNKVMLVSVKSTRKNKYNIKKEMEKLDSVLVPVYCEKKLMVCTRGSWNYYTI